MAVALLKKFPQSFRHSIRGWKIRIKMKQTALVIGATGLVGRQLVTQLRENSAFDVIHLFVRRPSEVDHSKVREHVVDFEKPDEWTHLLRGDVLFACMGTTIKTAGSQEAQWRVDHDYPLQTATRAANNSVKRLVLVSAVGANAGSRIFYNRMKGALDEAISALPFEQVTILRPSILAGNRTESRPGERIGLALMQVLRFIPGLRAYRPIDVRIVARAMVNSALSNRTERIRIIELDAIFNEAK